MRDDMFPGIDPLIGGDSALYRSHIASAIDIPEYKSYLYLTESCWVPSTKTMPNRWIRFWHKVFFGFRWEAPKE